MQAHIHTQAYAYKPSLNHFFSILIVISNFTSTKTPDIDRPLESDTSQYIYHYLTMQTISMGYPRWKAHPDY